MPTIAPIHKEAAAGAVTGAVTGAMGGAAVCGIPCAGTGAVSDALIELPYIQQILQRVFSG
jgi:hypothetical protein